MTTNDYTIIIPTWNRSLELSNTILSILKYCNLNLCEILIIDSYSDDNSENIVTNIMIQNNFSRFRYFNTTTNTPAHKRNMGISYCQTKWVLFLDDDCCITSNFFNIIESTINNAKEKVIFSGVVNYPQKWILKSAYFRYRDSLHFKEKANIYKESLSPFKIVTMNLLANANELKKSKLFFDENFVFHNEDTDFAISANKKGFNLYPMNASVVHFETSKGVRNYYQKMKNMRCKGLRLVIEKHPEITNKLNMPWSFFYSDCNAVTFKRTLFKFIFPSFFVSLLLTWLENNQSLTFFPFKKFLIQYIILAAYSRGNDE